MQRDPPRDDFSDFSRILEKIISSNFFQQSLKTRKVESGIIARKKRSGKVESGKSDIIWRNFEIGEIMMQWKIFAIKGNFAKLKILNM